MPAPYSLDLRERAINAYEKGEGTQEEIASLFTISLSTFRNWFVRLRDKGELKPKKHESRGRKNYIDEAGLAFIKALVKDKPDILISEIRALYKKTFKIKVSQSMVSRAFKALDLRRKKKSQYALEQEREDVKKKTSLGRRSSAIKSQ
jgi:transposase